VKAPLIKTALPGPKAAALIARDAKVVSPSYTRGYPLVIDHASGSTVEDVDGNVFLDCAAGIAVNSTGHSHPEVVKAIADQAGRFLHMSGTDFYYELQVRLAEEIAAMMDALSAPAPVCRAAAPDDGVAVLQKDLDRILALRRWFKESEAYSLVLLPGPSGTPEDQQQARELLLAEAWHVLAEWPAGRAAGSVV
jgi:hypothetical protein